jgi:hypothetical protein
MAERGSGRDADLESADPAHNREPRREEPNEPFAYPDIADFTVRDDSERTKISVYLSQQRRLRGISLAELGERTRIPIRSLERLEEGSFDDDIDGFVRGFVRTVAIGLGLDPDDTIGRMLVEPSIKREGTGRAGRIAAVAVVAAGCVVIALGVGLLAAQTEMNALVESGSEEPERLIRVDPVRKLADEQRRLAGQKTPPPVSLPPSFEAPAPDAPDPHEAAAVSR